VQPLCSVDRRQYRRGTAGCASCPAPPPSSPAAAAVAAPATSACRFNAEGDLLVTCGKDSNINLWWTDNGARAGSFDGHNGGVWTVDMTCERPQMGGSSGFGGWLSCTTCHRGCCVAGGCQSGSAPCTPSVLLAVTFAEHPWLNVRSAPLLPPRSTHCPFRPPADDSKVLLSAAGDSSARLWSMQDGRELFRFGFNEPARAARFSVGERLAAISTDPFMNSVSAIRMFDIAADPAEQTTDEVLNLTGPRGRITRLHWTDNNRMLLSSSEDGMVRRWDVEAGKCVAEAQLHDKQISDMQMSVDGTHFITASTDRTSKLVDSQVGRVGGVDGGVGMGRHRRVCGWVVEGVAGAVAIVEQAAAGRCGKVSLTRRLFNLTRLPSCHRLLPCRRLRF
jgi:hypothetical protein